MDENSDWTKIIFLKEATHTTYSDIMIDWTTGETTVLRTWTSSASEEADEATGEGQDENDENQ